MNWKVFYTTKNADGRIVKDDAGEVRDDEIDKIRHHLSMAAASRKGLEFVRV